MAGNKKATHSKILGIAILALALLAWTGSKVYYNNNITTDLTSSTHVVSRTSFTLCVNERGIVQPARIAPISSQISSNQAKIVWLAREGTEVNKGVIIARFDTKPFMDAMEKAEQAYADAQTSLQTARKSLTLQREEENGKIEAAARKLEIAKVEAANIIKGSGPLKREVIEQHLHQLERTLRIARDELNDFELLLQKGHISARERDKAKDKFATAQEDLQVAKAELHNFDTYLWPQMLSKAKLLVAGAQSDFQRVKRTAELLIQNRESEVEKNRRLAENRLKAVKQAKQDVINCDIYAPASGILLYSELPRGNDRRKVQIGDSIWVRQTFLQIPDTTALVAAINVREVDVAKIDPKMGVEIHVDAFPGKSFLGDVEKISALATEDTHHPGVRKFKTQIRFLGDTEKVHVGMSVSVKIIYRKLENVIAIPISSLIYADDTVMVNKATGEQWSEVPIQLGARGQLWVEVTDGLKVGDKIRSARR